MKHYFIFAILLAAIVGLGVWQVSFYKNTVISNYAAVATVSVTSDLPNCKSDTQIKALTASYNTAVKSASAAQINTERSAANRAFVAASGAANKQFLVSYAAGKDLEKAKTTLLSKQTVLDGLNSKIASTTNATTLANLKKSLSTAQKDVTAAQGAVASKQKTFDAADTKYAILDSVKKAKSDAYQRFSDGIVEKERTELRDKLKSVLDSFKAKSLCPKAETLSQCTDGIDNDRDGKADCTDSECSGTKTCKDWLEFQKNNPTAPSVTPPATNPVTDPVIGNNGGSGNNSGGGNPDDEGNNPGGKNNDTVTCCVCFHDTSFRCVDGTDGMEKNCRDQLAGQKCDITQVVERNADHDNIGGPGDVSKYCGAADSYGNKQLDVKLFYAGHSCTADATCENLIPVWTVLGDYANKVGNISITHTGCESFNDKTDAMSTFKAIQDDLKKRNWAGKVTLKANQNQSVYNRETNTMMCESPIKYVVCTESIEVQLQPCPMPGSQCATGTFTNTIECADTNGTKQTPTCVPDAGGPEGFGTWQF